MPLDYVWDKVVRPLIAERHEYADPSDNARSKEAAKPAASRPENRIPKAEGSKPTAEAAPPEQPKADEPGWSLPPDREKPAATDEDGDTVAEDENHGRRTIRRGLGFAPLAIRSARAQALVARKR